MQTGAFNQSFDRRFDSRSGRVHVPRLVVAVILGGATLWQPGGIDRKGRA